MEQIWVQRRIPIHRNDINRREAIKFSTPRSKIYGGVVCGEVIVRDLLCRSMCVGGDNMVRDYALERAGQTFSLNSPNDVLIFKPNVCRRT